MTSSAIHFRHDFPVKNEFLKLCASSFLVLNAQKIGMDIFILYMCFIHVPNHYTIYKNMIKENFSKSFSYILICAIVTTFYFYSNGELMYNENVFTISTALIISIYFMKNYIQKIILSYQLKYLINYYVF